MLHAARAVRSRASWFFLATLAVACGSDQADDFWSTPEGGSAGTSAGSAGHGAGTTSGASGNTGSSGASGSAGTAGTGTSGAGTAAGGSSNGGNGATSGTAPVAGGSDAAGGSSGNVSGGSDSSGGTGAGGSSTAGSDSVGGTAGTSGASNGGTGGDLPEGGSGAGDAGGAPSGGTSSGGNDSGGTSGTAAGGTSGQGASGELVAPVFDGRSGYVEIPDADIFSEPTTGELTVEAWMRPDSLDMPNQESSGYVHWLGKGSSGEHEWVARMYQRGNDEDRENRISFYSFNLDGGLGAGSYFQDDVEVGEWIHYVGSFDDVRTYIFKNGDQRDSDLLSGYDITPRNGDAPVRIATRDRNSYFQGAVARVAFYDSRLGEARIAAHYEAAGPGYDELILAEPSLVAYYPLNETSGTKAVDAKGDRDGTYHGDVELGAAKWPNP
ncbi:MAG TPA: LamG domain-containing protein [Polyangiaceae bacterium]